MLIEGHKSVTPDEIKELHMRGLIEVSTWTERWVRTPRTSWADIADALREYRREEPCAHA